VLAEPASSSIKTSSFPLNVCFVITTSGAGSRMICLVLVGLRAELGSRVGRGRVDCVFKDGKKLRAPGLFFS
jgi:hypothetical protein